MPLDKTEKRLGPYDADKIKIVSACGLSSQLLSLEKNLCELCAFAPLREPRLTRPVSRKGAKAQSSQGVFWDLGPEWAISFGDLIMESSLGGRNRVANERRHVLLQFSQRLQVNVHHMPRLVICRFDVPLQARIEVHVIDRVFGGEIGRGHVVIAVCDEELHERIFRERALERDARVGISVVRAPIPRRGEAASEYVIDRVVIEIQFAPHVIVEGGCVWRADRRYARVEFRPVAGGARINAGEAAVEPASGS